MGYGIVRFLCDTCETVAWPELNAYILKSIILNTVKSYMQIYKLAILGLYSFKT